MFGYTLDRLPGRKPAADMAIHPHNRLSGKSIIGTRAGIVDWEPCNTLIPAGKFTLKLMPAGPLPMVCAPGSSGRGGSTCDRHRHHRTNRWRSCVVACLTAPSEGDPPSRRFRSASCCDVRTAPGHRPDRSMDPGAPAAAASGPAGAVHRGSGKDPSRPVGVDRDAGHAIRPGPPSRSPLAGSHRPCRAARRRFRQPVDLRAVGSATTASTSSADGPFLSPAP